MLPNLTEKISRQTYRKTDQQSKPPTERSPGLDGFSGELKQTFKKELQPTPLKFFQKIEEEVHC